MKKINFFFEINSAKQNCCLLEIDDFVLKLPYFDKGIPFRDPTFVHSKSLKSIAENNSGINDWTFPTALQAAKIQANWFDILANVSKFIPYHLRWDRNDNPIWIWTSVFEGDKVFRFDINSGDMQLCEPKAMNKAYSFAVRELTPR